MAARTRKGTADKPWSEKTRERIQTSMLLNRLSDHVVGDNEMSQTQVRAAEILLRKALPDLSAMQIDGELKPSDSLMEVLKVIDGKSRDLPKSG